MHNQFTIKLKMFKIIIVSLFIFISSFVQAIAYEQDGYNWAADNDITDFDDCQDEFGTGIEEDECNRYLQEKLYGNSLHFNSYECTEDCSGHEAGYEWAENNYIDNIDDCGGNSTSFIEGCMAYVEENY